MKNYKEAKSVYMTFYGENGEVTSTDLPTKLEMQFYKGVELTSLSLMLVPFSFFGAKTLNEINSIQDLQSVESILALVSIVLPAMLFTSSNNYLGSGIGRKNRKGNTFTLSMLFTAFFIIPTAVLVSRLGIDGLYFIPFMFLMLYSVESLKTFKRSLSRLNLAVRKTISKLIYKLALVVEKVKR